MVNRRNAFEPGEKDDHLKAETLPDRHTENRKESDVGIGQPADIAEAEPADDFVEQTVRHVHPAPDPADRHQRSYIRSEIEDAVKTDIASELLQTDCDDEANGHRNGYADKHVGPGIAERFPEHLVVGHVPEVIETDKWLVERDRIPLVQAHPERVKGRADADGQEKDDRDQEERVRPDPLALLEPQMQR